MSASSSATDRGAVLAIDIGTQTTRAGLVEPDGSITDSESSPIGLTVAGPGLAEQSPQEWWSSTCHNVRSVLERTGARSVAAVAVGAHMHGVVPVDRDGAPLTELVPIWSDKRAAPDSEAIARRPDYAKLTRIAGNPASGAWAGTKIAWLAAHRPQVYAAASSFVVVKDFVTLSLTGRPTTDPSEASGTFLMDAARDEWSAPLLAALGVSRSKLPEIAPSDAVVGTVTADAARQTGLLAGTPVVAGAGDMLCALAATGLDRPGRVTEISGTAGVMAAWAEHPHPSPEVLNLRAAGDGWIHFGIADAGGLCLRWVAEELFDGDPAYGELTERAAAVPAGSNGLLFLPYLLGERTLGSSYARGSIIGVTPRHGRAEIVRAVLEGLCFEMRRSLDAFAADTAGLRVRVCGGGAISELWNQIRADVYGLPLCELAAVESGLLGTALLAGVAAGWAPSVRAAADRLVREKRQFTPGPDAAAYRNAYDRFCRAHDALTPFWDC